MNEEQLRAEFEKWCLEEQGLDQSNLYKLNSGTYGYYKVKDLWEAWKAGYELKQNRFKNLIDKIEGINDERDSVPLLLAIRKEIKNELN